jgi:hypothetical protein
VPPPGASPEEVKTSALRCDPVSDFKNEIRVTSQACGLVSRTGVGRKLAHGTFHFTVGLGSLFLGGGKPVHIRNRPTQHLSCVSSESAARASPMADWRHGGQRLRVGDERREGVNPDGRRPWPPRPGATARGFKGPPGRVSLAGSLGARGAAVGDDPQRGFNGGGADAVAGRGRGSFRGRGGRSGGFGPLVGAHIGHRVEEMVQA